MRLRNVSEYCSGISTRQPEPGRVPSIFSLLCQVHVTLNLWAQKEFSGYRETAAIHHSSPPLTDWESIIIKHPSAHAITINHLEGESIHADPLHTSLVLSLESESPDVNYSYSMIEDLESETHLQYLEYQWRSISTWNLYSSWCQSQLMMKLQLNKKTPNWVQPSRRKCTYQTAFNQFKRDTLIVKSKNRTAVVTMPTSDQWHFHCSWYI